MHPFLDSLAISAPEAGLSLAVLVLLMIGAFRGDKALTLITWASVAVYAVAALVVIAAPAAPQHAFGGIYVADAFSAFLKVLIYIGASVAALLALPYLKRSHAGRFEFPILLMLSAIGMSIMVSASDLLTLYVGLELQSLAAYVLAAFHRSEARSSEAGLKYFVLGALASGVLLYGVSLVYGFGGTTDFVALKANLVGGPTIGIGVLLGLIFVLSGLAFKISAVPFHMWTPDVYEGAPTPVAAFFASAPKVAAMGLLVRVAVGAFGSLSNEWGQIVSFVAVASMILGAVGAIGQVNVKRLLAYSSINNVGFALIGLATATPQGVGSVLFYMTVYMAMTLGSFSWCFQMRSADGEPVESLASLSGLGRTRPGLAAAMAVFMFSLAGIPPLLGFWPKFSVFQAAMNAHLYVLATIGVVTSVVGAYYYLRVVKTMYFDEPAPAYAPSESAINGVLIGAAALFCSPIGMLAITPLVAAAMQAAHAIF